MSNEAMVLKGEEQAVEVSNYAPTNTRETAEVQSAMVIAKRFPRDEKMAMDRVLNACTREGLAAAARYEYARGGTDISGPSIRLAEALATCWGNIQHGIRELEQVRNPDGSGESVIEAFCWDVETNVRSTKTFKVPHIRYSRNKGNTKLEDPRDIYEGVANQGARRLRACILAIIPGDVTDAALKQCDLTLAAKVKLTPDRIKSMLEKFSEVGVTKAQVEKKIQRRVDTITPAQFVNLGNIYNSVKDGMSVAGDWFEALPEDKPAEPKPGKKKLGDVLPPKAEEPGADEPVGNPEAQDDLKF